MIPTFIDAVPAPYTGAPPKDFPLLLRIVAANTTYQWNDQGNTSIYTGTAAPHDTSGVWFKDDGSGNPVGVYAYYGGHWRPVPQGGDATGLKYFYGYWPSYFDGTGKGIVNQPWDGYALCNGNNGTPNLANKFLVPGAYYNFADGAWLTTVEGIPGTYKASGGQTTVSMTPEHLPALTWQILLEQQFSGALASNNQYVLSTDTGPSTGLGAAHSLPLVMFDPASAGGFRPIYTLPPYLVMGVAMWIGY
jgi:hypothetical protein